MAISRERTFAALSLVALLATSCGGTQLDTASAPEASAATSTSVDVEPEPDSAAAGEDFSFDSVSGETTVVWFWAPG